MLDYEKQRQLVIVVILGIILVVIFSIIALIFIWMPEEEKEPVFEVGIVEGSNVEGDDILYNYYEQISKMLIAEDTDSICELVGEDYLEYNELTKDDIKKYLQDKGVLGSKLELVTTSTYRVPGYSNIYYLDIKVASEVHSIGIVIREKSPENYTIAFDKFIDYSTNVYRGTVNSVELDVYKRVRYTNSVEYTFRLKNNYDKDVTINSNSLANSILLVSSDSSAKRPIMTTLSTSQVKLQPNLYRMFTAVYNMNDSYDYWSYNTLVLKDVMYDGMQGTTDIEYNLSK